MVFLPEFMFRWNFPGRSLLAGRAADGRTTRPDHPAAFQRLGANGLERSFRLPAPGWLPGWLRPFFRNAAAMPGCHFPFYALRRLGALQWQPPIWYRPWWPRMRAFALPSYGDGCIRINLQGPRTAGHRRPRRIRTGLPRIDGTPAGAPRPAHGPAAGARGRAQLGAVADAPGDRVPDADLVVLWQLQANDMSEDSEAGRLGPVPFWKSGSHRPTGFVLGLGPGIPRRDPGGPARVIDLAPTVLDLLGAGGGERMDGRPLFRGSE